MTKQSLRPLLERRWLAILAGDAALKREMEIQIAERNLANLRVARRHHESRLYT